MPTTRDRIEEFLKKAPDGLTVRELAQFMECDQSEMNHTLRKMSYKDRVNCIDVNGQQKWYAN